MRTTEIVLSVFYILGVFSLVHGLPTENKARYALAVLWPLGLSIYGLVSIVIWIKSFWVDE